MALLPQLGLGMSTRNAYVAYDGLESDPPVNMVTINYLFDFTSQIKNKKYHSVRKVLK
jgi:hypothetical protein